MSTLSLAGPTVETLQVAGHTRTLSVVHRQEPGPGPAPLVLLLHGSNQSGSKFRAFTGDAFDRFAAEQDGAVVAYLDGYKAHWNDARIENQFAARAENYDDVGFVRATIDLLVRRYGGDRARVYVIGYSNGGQMVIRLVHEIPDLLAGAAILSATQPVAENFAPDAPLELPLPIFLVHGTKDPLVPYQGGMASMWGFRARGLGMSAPRTAEYYARRNGITTEPVSRTVTPADDHGRTSVERTDYRQDGHRPVTLCTVHGGGHTIPGTKKATSLMGRTDLNFDTVGALSEFFRD
jgi:polyhydroxybutyrate depolymerase